MNAYTVKPYDVLFFRGNKSFDIGVWYSDGVFPPLPSTFQGFVRTALLIKNNQIDHNGKLRDENKAKELVGDDVELKFDLTGPFVLSSELFVPTPLDLIHEDDQFKIPDLGGTQFMTDLGFNLYALDAGNKPKWAHDESSLINKSDLNQYRQLNSPIAYHKPPVEVEDHVGIQLDYGDAEANKKQAREGMFYMTPYRRFAESAGLLFSTDCTENLDGLAGKLGSEGRGANIKASSHQIKFKQDDQFYEELAKAKRFKLVLLQPGVFQTGWLPFPAQIKNKEMILDHNGLELKLLYARMGSSLRISGFSYRNLKVGDKSSRGIGLKPMLNAVPAGAVYYFEILNPSDNVPDILKSLDGSKIRNKPYCQMGYNHVILAKLK